MAKKPTYDDNLIDENGIGADPVGEYDEPEELTDEEIAALDKIAEDYGPFILTPEQRRVFGIDPPIPPTR